MTNEYNRHICMIFLGDIRFDGRGHNMMTSLVRSGYRVTIIATGGESRSFPFHGAEVRRVKLHRWSLTKLRFLEFYLKSFIVLLRLKADLYQAEDLFSLPIAWFGSRFHGGKLSYDCRELYFALGSLVGRRWTQSFWRIVERIWIVKADLVLITARNQQDIIADRYDIDPPTVVRNHPPMTRPSDDPFLLRKELDIPGDCRILLYQGMLHPGRGIFLPLEILRRLDGCVAVYIAYGELRGELERTVREYGLGTRVYLLGPVPYADLLALTSGADIGLALQEPFGENHLRARPNKVFEYIMAGVPVVASDFPPLRKAIVENQVGLVVDVENIDDIVEKVGNLLNDKELYKRMAVNCRKAAHQYSWEVEESVLMPAVSRILA